MKAELLERSRIVVGDNAFVEFVLWRVPAPLPGSSHSYKYRLALVQDEVCTVRYDNEAGKGDHRHIGGREEAYRFTTVERLMVDFLAEVDKRMKRK